MKALITGVGGFIGSTLADTLLAQGATVVGVDSFTDYYDREVKAENIQSAVGHDLFELVEGSVIDTCNPDRVADADVIFHTAAQPGVRGSWGRQFEAYIENNIRTTQVLLEVVAESASPPKVVYSSSSSVYGIAKTFPLSEDSPTQPHSPYGVTKLAAEHLCSLYASTRGVDTVSLRYFTVYGPRQRPDMAFNRLLRCAVNGWAFPLLGDGKQIRDFTFVDDVVNANIAVATNDVSPGSVFNVAGGSSVSLAEAISVVESLCGTTVELDRREAARGDVVRTAGSTDRLKAATGWASTIDLRTGLERQLAQLQNSPRLSFDDLSV